MNRKLSKLAVGLVAVLAFSGQANATSYTVDSTALNSISGYSNTATINGIFSDVYDFTLGSGSNFSSTATPFTFTVTQEVTIPGFGTIPVSINSITSPLIETLFNTTTNTQVSLSSNTTLLGADSYAFTISGTGSGTSGLGSYNVNLHAVAVPVPEPTEGALFLSGIGLLGFIAVRRRNND